MDPARRLRFSKRIAVIGLSASAFCGCAGVGPSALRNGRSTYNDVINATEDEQILAMIVRQRYDETFGMLSVSSVTASLRVGASAESQFAIGPLERFAGNLVPLAAGTTYEDNPTISYVPLKGEQFMERMLAPVSAEQAMLLSRMSTPEVEVFRLLVRRVNGLVNPLYSSRPANESFDRFITLYAGLREKGELDVIQSGAGQLQLYIHDFDDKDAHDVDELLKLFGVQATRKEKEFITIPLRFFVGAPRGDGLDLETPSALEIIEVAARGVDVPEAHRKEGIVRAIEVSPHHEFIDVHCALFRPSDALVAIPHRGYWFYVDDHDVCSKRSFMVLRTLIGMRMDEPGTGQKAPVLTVPVSH